MRTTSGSNQDNWVSGDHYVICDQCGFKYYYSECKMQWDNLLVCDDCYEPRQPQDFVKSVQEKIGVEVSRPEGTDSFITTDVTQDDL